MKGAWKRKGNMQKSSIPVHIKNFNMAISRSVLNVGVKNKLLPKKCSIELIKIVGKAFSTCEGIKCNSMSSARGHFVQL